MATAPLARGRAARPRQCRPLPSRSLPRLSLARAPPATRRARPSHAVAAMAVVAASRTRRVPLRPAHPAFQRRAMAAAATGRACRRRQLLPPPAIVAAERSSPWSPYLRPPSSPNDHPAAFPTSQGSSSTKPPSPHLAGAPPRRLRSPLARRSSWRHHYRPPRAPKPPPTGAHEPPHTFPPTSPSPPGPDLAGNSAVRPSPALSSAKDPRGEEIEVQGSRCKIPFPFSFVFKNSKL